MQNVHKRATPRRFQAGEEVAQATIIEQVDVSASGVSYRVRYRCCGKEEVIGHKPLHQSMRRKSRECQQCALKRRAEAWRKPGTKKPKPAPKLVMPDEPPARRNVPSIREIWELHLLGCDAVRARAAR
jgi:hypothetical protein